MGLGNFTKGSLGKKYDELNEELFKIAEEVWDNPRAGTPDGGQKYRQMILDEYMNEDPIPRRYSNGRSLMSEERSRLNRAINKVADAVDRNPETVRDCAINRMYEDKYTHRFVNDLNKIEQKWERRK